ncbi:HAMP domain-containing sensor histidine kinase [Pseudomonas sp. 10B1]|uniref:sensor histidine kinase n=1 Tax=unclassified Pseudomonas TaxID=196821 RepID=UPI002AB4EA77|nr:MULTISPECIES: HAMP domain-containing sensor histidine kinase [unclassified Pseudomonas]MDY7559640.1 HAMP domain-containing sensor histidine kinase [Pseudomonas sp. AB6]MEA9977984.1 HAMP domain-containing sensor histidine kinase [Pseudomonas sp. RTS4]MEA9993124.1 HAMP domain-containing sensor histidine kinase [Pseudomonas sp. AA4]MEB0086066.1 HAMP domain-containing sensor histidine kinase [Pseudomonas sp. RTI1]MEB0125498.1 HAMP domain-containing sensor histidine kinase [Pseudomonas sp. CCC1.
MNDNGLDFSMVIASVVHDMKNSLSTLMHAHSQWLTQLTKAQQDVPEHGAIEYEFAHLNGMLVQLLGLYKLGVNQLPLRPDYHELDDFIEALLACHQDVLHSHGIVANYEIEGFNELGFFDRELISSVVANIIINAIRYARHTILITAHEEDGQLVLTVNDDGPGYPAQMLEHQSDYVQGINQRSGSTGLGLYFAARIAERHERNGVRGHIELANGGKLGGGKFIIYLP